MRGKHRSQRQTPNRRPRRQDNSKATRHADHYFLPSPPPPPSLSVFLRFQFLWRSFLYFLLLWYINFFWGCFPPSFSSSSSSSLPSSTSSSSSSSSFASYFPSGGEWPPTMGHNSPNWQRNCLHKVKGRNMKNRSERPRIPVRGKSQSSPSRVKWSKGGRGKVSLASRASRAPWPYRIAVGGGEWGGVGGAAGFS